MDNSFDRKYPLSSLLEVKQHRLESAERELAEAQRILEQQKRVLTNLESEKARVESHRQEHLNRLRNQLDIDTTPHTIKQLKTYLQVVSDKLNDKQAAVDRQKRKVEEAINHLQLSEHQLTAKRKEMEKITTHQHIWKKEANAQLLAKEALEHDELGNTQHIRQQTQRDA